MSLDRRAFVRRLLAGLGIVPLGGCDQLTDQSWVQRLLAGPEVVNHWLHRDVLPQRLAPEYGEADLSPRFRANGTTDPSDPHYRQLAADGFRRWRLRVGGMVERARHFSLDELRALPSRTQITRHDCVEGWSCIGKWTGVPLADLLSLCGVRPQARFVVFHCADTMDGSNDRYYESIGMEDALHPQTILAYGMNGEDLPIRHGAPLRLRVERQLGYKMAKYVMAVEATDRLDGFGRGKGGYWEDRGYEWYAGI